MPRLTEKVYGTVGRKTPRSPRRSEYTVEELRQNLKELGVRGYSRMRKHELEETLEKVSRRKVASPRKASSRRRSEDRDEYYSSTPCPSGYETTGTTIELGSNVPSGYKCQKSGLGIQVPSYVSFIMPH